MIFEKIKHLVISLIMRFLEFLYPPKDIKYSKIPIIINNFNRLDYLKKLLCSLENRECENIIILDNKSTYPPLLEFYKQTKHRVIFLNKNYGYRALWKSGIYKQFIHNFFVYTDSDLEIIDTCPANFMAFFKKTLQRNKSCKKVGFSLKIDDIPKHYKLKKEVINWEKKFYENKKGDMFFKAPIDTTFAMYQPYSFKHTASNIPLMLRTEVPYQMRHLPWYVDSTNLSEEEKNYLKTTKVKNWVK